MGFVPFATASRPALGPHPASYPMRTKPRVQEADHSPPAWWLVKHRDIFTFTYAVRRIWQLAVYAL
jgi:hypothetical protein